MNLADLPLPPDTFGSAELKEKYLPDLAAGKKIGCFVSDLAVGVKFND